MYIFLCCWNSDFIGILNGLVTGDWGHGVPVQFDAYLGSHEMVRPLKCVHADVK